MDQMKTASAPILSAADYPLSKDQPRIRVLLLISSLEHGGAERQVVQLANHLDPDGFEVRVCSLSAMVPLAEGLKDKTVRLRIIEKKSRYDFSVVPRLAGLMSDFQPHIVHAFLFDAEMAARLASRLTGVPVVIASERNSDYRRPLIHSLCQRLTQAWFDVMIANSNAGKRFNMKTLGLAEHRIQVVHSAVDVDYFHSGSGLKTRQELGIDPDDYVVGMVANFKRQKNHDDFFRAAKGILAKFPNTWFLCVGEPLRDNQQGSEDYHQRIRRAVTALGIGGRCLFLGHRRDMPAIYNACDVTVLTSSREGTPNVLLESMACGVPVVATDVADNSYIVPDGQVGFIVPLHDIAALVDRVTQFMSERSLASIMGLAARSWVAQQFSTTALIKKMAAIYVQRLNHKLGVQN